MAKRHAPSRKGFPIKLQKPRWHLLLAALTYQIYVEHEKGVRRKDLRGIRSFFEEHLAEIPMQMGGMKTIRVRANQVPLAAAALRFAAELHQGNGHGTYTYPSNTGRVFSARAVSLESIGAIELLADAGR